LLIARSVAVTFVALVNGKFEEHLNAGTSHPLAVTCTEDSKMLDFCLRMVRVLATTPSSQLIDGGSITFVDAVAS